MHASRRRTDIDFVLYRGSRVVNRNQLNQQQNEKKHQSCDVLWIVDCIVLYKVVHESRMRTDTDIEVRDGSSRIEV